MELRNVLKVGEEATDASTLSMQSISRRRYWMLDEQELLGIVAPGHPLITAAWQALAGKENFNVKRLVRTEYQYVMIETGSRKDEEGLRS